MKKITVLFLMFVMSFCYADNEELTLEEKEYLRKIDSVQQNFKYQEGAIDLNNGLALLKVPEGYTFLGKEEGEYVLEKLWGNPHSEIIGLMFPKGITATSSDFTYAVEITYTEDGYVSDEDAEDIDYDELLEQMKEDSVEENKERVKQEYPSIELVGWAAAPFYDRVNKKLHWAKELKFDGYEENTLNYNVRVLGRKGYLNLNIIGDMSQLDVVNKDIDEVLNSVHFSKGYTYKEFNPEMDNLAAYGIGGLIAGKILAKAGVFALLLKFWKVLAVAVVGAFSVFKKKIFGEKNK